MTQTTNAERIAAHPDTVASAPPSLEPSLPAAAPGTIPAESLFRGAQEIRILHRGDQYCLRITRNDKLILTK